MSADEIWQALSKNQIKLPNTTSIDRFGHGHKNDHGYFIKEENVNRFLACTIPAFYGSALEMFADEHRNITALVERMTQFFGPNVGILTGGGERAMGWRPISAAPTIA